MDYLWLILCLAGILAAAELFTNAVEWIGYLYKLGGGGVGSILAAVGTALPETMIPLIALIGAAYSGNAADVQASQDVGIGAILGAPFMLGCVAFAVAAFAKSAYNRTGRRPRPIEIDSRIFGRDIGAFLMMYTLAIACSFFPEKWMKLATAGILVLSYATYAFITFRDDKADLEFPKACLFDSKCEIPRFSRVWFQLFIALSAIIGLAFFFVEEVKEVSTLLGVNPLVLSLIIAPLATELPEKFNSVIWMRECKDTLALGNIAGAMVFQSTFPVAVGIIFTDWVLWDKANPETFFAILSAIFALIAAAYLFILNRLGIRIRARLLAAPILLYITYIAIVFIKG